ALVTCPTETCTAALAGLDRDGALATVRGERVAREVAGTVVADLREQSGRGNDALGIAKEGKEQRSVWMRADCAGDRARELADLADDRTQRAHEADDGGAAGLRLELANDCLGRIPEPAQQLAWVFA